MNIIINYEDVMKDQIYVLPEKWIAKRKFLMKTYERTNEKDEDVMEDQIYVLPEKWILKSLE